MWRARIAALPSRFSLFAASVRMTVFSKKIGKNHVYSYTCEVLDGVGRILTSDLPYPRLLSHTVIPKKEANSRRGEALRSLYYSYYLATRRLRYLGAGAPELQVLNESRGGGGAGWTVWKQTWPRCAS